MTRTLAGKMALIAGGSRGLGAATAEAFAEHGADIAISYVSCLEHLEPVIRIEPLLADGGRLVVLSSQAQRVAITTPSGGA